MTTEYFLLEELFFACGSVSLRFRVTRYMKEYILEKRKNGTIKREAERAICEFCKEEFLKPIRFREQKFCSKSCSHKSRMSRENMTCSFCGNEFSIPKSKVKNSKSGFHFCSRLCKDKAQRIENGFQDIWPDHYGSDNLYRDKALKFMDKKCCSCGDETEHHLVIHHIDGDRNNNCIENLEIVCWNCHSDRHLKQREDGEWVVNFHSLSPRNIL